MGLSTPRGIYGVHSFTPYSRLDATPYGTLKVLAGSSLSFSGTMVPLMGGSGKYPWAQEEGAISSQLNLKTREYPDFLIQLFGGATPTENGADASGAITTLTNKNGTSLMNSTTGIASVAVISGSETDLKFGKYVIKVITSTTVQIYAYSDIDFARGTAEVFASDVLALSATTFTVTATTATNITGWGFKFTGGSGSISMTVGDTATFQIRPKNTANMSSTIGGVTSVFPTFGAVMYAKKQGDGRMFEVDCPNLKGEGVPFNFDENKWSEADIKVGVMYDATIDGVATVRAITPTTPL